MSDDRRRDSDLSTKLTYLLIGGGIGAIIALLFAPKSGQELREDIADVTRKGIDRTREAAGQLKDRAGEYYEVGRQRAGEYYEAGRDRAAELYSTASERVGDLAHSAREAAGRQTGPISAAIDAGKKAYVEEKRRTEASVLSAAPNYPEEKEN
jgi:gas vesicle protein